jgi:hypothetical protein
MKPYSFRCLVDQVTGQIVWMTFNESAEVPIIDPTLNYYRYNGSTNISVWSAYATYELFLDEDGKTLVVKPRGEIDTRIQTIRAKYVTIDLINAIIKVHYERQGFPEGSIYRRIDASSKWVGVLAEMHSCSTEDAATLLDFKISEFKNTEFMLESRKMMMVQKLKEAECFADVADVYAKYTSLFFNINRKDLMAIDSIRGELL